MPKYDNMPGNIKPPKNVSSKESADYISHVLKIQQMKKCDFDDPQAVKDRITFYFQCCAEDGMKPTTTGMALALGVSRRFLMYVVNGERKANNPEVIDVVRQGMQMLEGLTESYMMDGKINPVSGIFLMTNNYEAWEQHASKKETTIHHVLELPDEKMKQRYLTDYITPEYTEKKEGD